MLWIKLSRQLIILALTFTLVLITFTSCITQIQAQPAKPLSTVVFVPPSPPDRGTPSGRQRGGASRGGQCPDISKPLTALVPAIQHNLDKGQVGNLTLTTREVVWGLTVADPTLWFYVPYSLTPELPVEFVLQDAQDKNIYKTYFTPSEKPPGIIKFRLPSTAAPLDIGKMYHWYFSIYCVPDAPVFVEGWVKRVALNSTLMSQLQKETLQQRVALYAANGIWHDALTTLAELRRTHPGDTRLSNDWVSLLQSAGLAAIAEEPIIECCIPD